VALGLPTELSSVVGQDRTDGDPEPIVEGQHAIVHEVAGRDRHLRGVDLGEGEGARHVDDDLDVDLAHTLERAPAERVLVKQLARPRGYLGLAPGLVTGSTLTVRRRLGDIRLYPQRPSPTRGPSNWTEGAVISATATFPAAYDFAARVVYEDLQRRTHSTRFDTPRDHTILAALRGGYGQGMTQAMVVRRLSRDLYCFQRGPLGWHRRGRNPTHQPLDE